MTLSLVNILALSHQPLDGGGRATACGYSFPPCERAEGDKDSYLDSKIHQLDLIPNGPEKMGPKQQGRLKDFRGN